jgi:plasmid stabilization system protein ParE
MAAMTRQVVVTARAKKELYEAVLWWAANRSTEQAIRWMEGFEAAILNLAQDAERHPLVSEASTLPRELRQLIYGLGRRKTHRAIFEIRGDQVFVHLIRHLAQDAITKDDF